MEGFVDFFYWITAEDLDLLKYLCGDKYEDDALMYFQIIASLVVCRYLAEQQVAYELVDAGLVFAGSQVVLCYPIPPFAESFFLPPRFEERWVAVVRVDLGQQTGRMLGWFWYGRKEKRTHILLEELKQVKLPY